MSKTKTAAEREREDYQRLYGTARALGYTPIELSGKSLEELRDLVAGG
mgnify:CR=1 FL=1